MRKILFMTLVLVMAFSAAASAAEAKIGVIHSREIVAGCDAGKVVLQKLEKDFSSMGKDIENQKANIIKLRDELQKQGMMLSLEARQDKELEYKRKVRDLQDLTQAFQRKRVAQERELLAPVMKAVAESVKRIGTTKKFSVILDLASKGSDILFFDDTINITKDIIADVNANYKK
ncbi:MAG: OmpH family outer membrane protein [Desulfovibrio sp.]